LLLCVVVFIAPVLGQEDAQTLITKGNDFLGQGKYEEAIKCYDKAIEIKPDYALAWYNKGYTLRRQGKSEEVLKCYDRAIKIKPDYVDAWFGKGIIYLCKAGFFLFL